MKLYKREIWLRDYPKDLGATYCVFCDKKEQKNYLIWEGRYWKILHNKYPYLGMKKHIILIPIRHIKTNDEMTQEMCYELPEAHKFIKKFFGDEDYFSLTRESFGGRSLEHLHTHFLPGIVQGSDVEYILEKQGFTNQLASE